MALTSSPSHTWKFFRAGGLDQAALETADDLLDLEKLDQKLWVALSCPVTGLELDEKTLALIDSDGDGRIRVPELIAAVKWASARLKDPAGLLRGDPALPLAAINEAAPDGPTLLASARQILSNLGKKGADSITPAESGNTAQIFAASPLNGDGVIPPEATDDPAAQALIKDIIACLGGTADRTGSVGVTAEKIDAFFADAAAYVDWVGMSAAKDIAVLGEATDAAVAALRAVRPKVEDFFARCRLAAFDARATAALNRSEVDFAAMAAKVMDASVADVTDFPLAHVEAGRALPLIEGVNPAWAAALATLQRSVVAPVLGASRTALTEAEWAALNSEFAAYETWLGGKAGRTVEKLGLARLKEILDGKEREVLSGLVARDRALEPEFKAISDVNRLVHYHRDMRTLLHNFVNFADFYSRDRHAVFQAGTLFLDSRSTDLCLRVDGPSALAAMSKIYIAYCACTRPGATMNIAACFMQGTGDFLFVGRHGVFYDRQGRDWDAVITSLAANPISLRQAFWAPYKKLVRMIDELVAKRSAAANAAADDRLTKAANLVVNADKAAAEKAAREQAQAQPPPPKKIDVGTVAALGVGVGAISGALATIAAGFARIAWWQVPLVLVGVVLAISLPSVIIAWIKLRQRTLGPVLDANGWAINGRVAINIPLGTALTELATLPPGARRSLADPYEDKEAAARRRQFWLLVVLVVLVGVEIWIRWDRHQQGHYFWEPAPPAAAAKPENKAAK